MKKRLRCFIALFYLATAFGSVQAALTIEITQGVEGALPVAIIPFAWEGADAVPLDIAEIISADLRRSGRFSPLPEKDLLAKPHDASQINFRDWRLLGAENLVIGKVRPAASGYVVQFHLFDVFRSNQLTGYTIRTSAENMRRTAHQISDIIYETLIGEPGAFATRIAYVTEIRKSPDSRLYTLLIADADGYNPRPVLNSKWPLMSPAWSPDGKKLAYVSFESRRPEIYAQEIHSGKRQLISSGRGLNGAPAWSPDGRRMAMVLSKGGNPDIYLYDFASKKLQRITRSHAIDTEPAWSPDGKSIVFTSDRGGSPQLYRMAVGDGRIERLTFEGKENARATFSPDGKLLAMVHGDQGRYRIGVMEMDTGALRVLTNARLDESPSFAPNGSMIIYASEEGFRGVLSAVSVDGRVRQKLFLKEGDAREPAWSPYSQ